MNTFGGPDELTSVELLTRALVGLTMHSVDILGGTVTLTQFRLLLVLDGLGEVPSSRLAAELGMVPSSVTRLAGRLAAAGLLTRGADGRSRSIVTLAVTDAGRQLVDRVVRRRRELLAGVLDQMEPGERRMMAAAAARFAELSGQPTASLAGPTGPLPL